MKILSIILISYFFCALDLQAQKATCGIGADVLITHWTEGDHLQIVGVASNSPAAQAGLKPNQFVLAIDGVPTAGLNLADCVKRIQGEAGKRITLEVADWQHSWTNSITLVRKVIPGDPLAMNPDAYEVPKSLRRKVISITTNQIIQLLSTNGTITAIQFTYFGATNANYRWRSRSTNGTFIKTGSGSVFENYEGQVDAFGEHQVVRNSNSDNMYVKAGNIRLEWSIGGPLYGWIYYSTSHEKFTILNSVDFNSDSVWLKTSH